MRSMKLKRKHKKAIAIGAVVVAFVMFVFGAYVLQTLPPEPSMDLPDWFELASARTDRETMGYVCLAGGVFLAIVSFQSLIRQATKLRV
jgi:hypothetical protein